MSRAAISVFVWGIYMFAMGTTFLLIPNVVLPLFGYPPTNEIWIRVVAMLSIALFVSLTQPQPEQLRLSI